MTRQKSNSNSRWTFSAFTNGPRVTKPYTDEQWKAINALGEKVDERLEEGDVRPDHGR